METTEEVTKRDEYIMRFIILLIFVSLANASCSKLQVYNDNSLNDKMFDTFLLGENSGIDHLFECTTLCQADTDCMSFCYSEGEGKCRLHETGFYKPTDGTVANGWKCYKHSDANCPVKDGFVHIRSSNLCIHMAPDTYSHTDAREYCEDKNSAIISLPSTTKRQAFETLIGTVFEGMFTNVKIGLKKEGNVWRWENGDALGAESRWRSGQPYCGETGPCSCANMLKVWDWRWNDHNCNTALPVVCEIDLP